MKSPSPVYTAIAFNTKKHIHILQNCISSKESQHIGMIVVLIFITS